MVVAVAYIFLSILHISDEAADMQVYADIQSICH